MINVVVVFGLPGSGKSYFAERLAKLIEAVYISSDKVREKLGLRGDYSLESKMKVYRRMIQEGMRAIEHGKLVVMDGTFHLKKFRDMLSNSTLDDQICFIEVATSEQLTKQRTEQRRASSDADFEVYKKLKREFEPLRAPHLKLTSTNHNLRELLDEAIDHIELSKVL